MGATRQWKIQAAEPHTVRVQHAIHSGRVKLYVNDCRVFDGGGPEAIWDGGFEHSFEIDGVPCHLKIVNRRCELWFNGVLQA